MTSYRRQLSSKRKYNRGLEMIVSEWNQRRIIRINDEINESKIPISKFALRRKHLKRVFKICMGAFIKYITEL